MFNLTPSSHFLQQNLSKTVGAISGALAYDRRFDGTDLTIANQASLTRAAAISEEAQRQHRSRGAQRWKRLDRPVNSVFSSVNELEARLAADRQDSRSHAGQFRSKQPAGSSILKPPTFGSPPCKRARVPRSKARAKGTYVGPGKVLKNDG